MFQRCENPNTQAWRHYGGRGISICDAWRSFEVFLKDMGKKPTQWHSLDRIDCNGNYEPSNCRWASKAVQSRNQRRAKLTVAAVTELKKMAEAGFRHAEIGKRLGISPRHVSAVVCGRRWA